MSTLSAWSLIAVSYFLGLITLYGIWIFRKGNIVDASYRDGHKLGETEGFAKGKRIGYKNALKEIALELQERVYKMENHRRSK